MKSERKLSGARVEYWYTQQWRLIGADIMNHGKSHCGTTHSLRNTTHTEHNRLVVTTFYFHAGRVKNICTVTCFTSTFLLMFYWNVSQISLQVQYVSFMRAKLHKVRLLFGSSWEAQLFDRTFSAVCLSHCPVCVDASCRNEMIICY